MSKFLEYGARYYPKMIGYLLEHLGMCVTALLISLFIAVIVSILLLKNKTVSKIVVAVLGAFYAIPSMAFFAILIPIFGLGKTDAVVVLIVYSQFILVRNILAGFNGVDSMLLEAAKGMGMSPVQIFFKVQLPLVLPVVLGGIRIAIVVTISSATIAQTVNAGGIGVLLFDGLRTLNIVKMIWGTILTALLTLGFNYFLERLERYTLKRSRGEIVKN